MHFAGVQFSGRSAKVSRSTSAARHARPRASYRGYRAPGVDGGCDSPTALAPAEAKRILLWVCSPIKGEISPQIAVTKPGVLRKTMSSEVEG